MKYATHMLSCLLMITLGLLSGCKTDFKQNASTPIPQSQETAGELIFVNNCAGCHAGGDNGMNPSKPIRHSSKLVNRMTFISFLRNPSGGMPPYDANALSDEQAEQLLAYLKKAFP